VKGAKEKRAILARKRKHYQKNKEPIRVKNREYQTNNKVPIAKNAREYQRNHLEEHRISNQKREAKKRELPRTLTVGQWESIKVVFENKCAYCGKEKPLEQDHFVPLNSRGEYTHNNIIPACRSCNSSKHDYDFFDWYPKRKSWSRERENKILKHLNYDKKRKQQLALF